MSWFEQWFNTPYYHILYNHRNDEEAQYFIDNLLNVLQPAPNASFLDLACGKGRHAIYIRSKGYDVTGLDIAANSIQQTRKYEDEYLRFYVHDMRLPFPQRNFDFILNLFTSFGYFDNPEDNVKVLNNISEALKNEGKFVLDFLNLHYVKKHLVHKEEIQKQSVVFQIERRIENGFIYKDIKVKDGDKHLFYQEKVQAFTYADFEKMFTETNLQIVETYGSYALGAYHSENSPRLIIVAGKQS